ncbi:MAG: nucleoside-diphosphate sugar epimerase/dehydratase [Ilumatobacteraceae bacterium]
MQADLPVTGNRESTTGKQLWAQVASRSVHFRTDLPLALLDAALVTTAYLGMLVLRYDGSVSDTAWNGFLQFLPIAIATTLASNGLWGLYGQLWKHASLYEARLMVLSGSTIATVLFLVEWRLRDVPLSVVIGGTLLFTFLMGLVRFQRRLFSYRRTSAGAGMRVVVIGAGDAGAGLVADMLRSPRAGFTPVAVIDEDPALRGRTFMGLTIAGQIAELPTVVESTGAHLAVFAMTNAPQETVRCAAAAAEAADVALKIVPGMSSTMRSGTTLRDIRDVQIEDLLGRAEISVDQHSVRSMISGRRVLITGAGGSIGSEIARQVAACEPGRLILLDHDETHLYELANELTDGFVVQVLADIRNEPLINRIFAEHRPAIVFHAAAHKHVPLLEAHPAEAVMTNVLGTSNVLNAAVDCHVERLVFISTDKAVYPSSVMGASKRIGEQLVLARTPPGAAFCAVRFGNVLGSRGSVVPTFMRQIERGGPVTLTDRRMTRFFMSIEEAVQLVLQSAAICRPANGGEVFMLDMGEPVLIEDLARRMIRLSGHKPDDEIAIEVVGVRPGEKLAEELTAIDEAEHPTSHPSIRRVSPIAIEPERLAKGVIHLDHLAAELDDERCRCELRDLALVERRKPTRPTPSEGTGID